MSALTIDIFSDIICPWCFIGARRLDKTLASLEPGLDVTITYHPYLLDPDAPPAGAKVTDHLREKYGRDPGPIFARVEEAGRASGIALDFTDQYTYPTVKAHTLLGRAAAKGTQHALADALFTAHFLDHVNVSDDAVLVEIATRHGFEADEARALLADASEIARTREAASIASSKGIRGVPFFVFNGRLAVSGAQTEEVFRDAIQQALQAPVGAS